MINYTTRLNSLNVSSLTKKIKDAKSIILTTHKQCDGDGLGAALGLYHGLKKIGKEVRVMMVDEVPTKYNFLDLDKYIETFNRPHKAIENTDLALIFDTNDRRIVEPLYSTLEEKCDDVLFVDHHPVLNDGPEPTAGSYIETKAASTGEISYFIIKDLGIRMDKAIARALYTSISFDTQLFRFVRGSGTSHLICAELLEYEKNPEEIHREIFSTYSIGKVMFLSKVLSDIEYFADGQVAVVHIEEQHLNKHELEMDDSRDIIDMVMNITSVQGAALFREEGEGIYKLSLRSKGQFEVLGIAESFSGGGHLYAAGATLHGEYEHVKLEVVDHFLQRIDARKKSSKLE